MTKEMLYRIKAFAPINNLLTDEEIKITADHPYMAVTNPWMDQSNRFELKNSEAVKTWGLTTVIDFCEKMEGAFNKDNLTYTLIEKVYGLSCDGFDALTEYVHGLLENDDVPLETIIKNYIWGPKKGGASKEVKALLNNDEVTLKMCKEAFYSMLTTIR